MTLRYLGPWDPGTIDPWDSWTLGLGDLFPLTMYKRPLAPETILTNSLMQLKTCDTCLANVGHMKGM